MKKKSSKVKPKPEIELEIEVDRPRRVRVFGRDFLINYVPSYTGMQDSGMTLFTNSLVNIQDHQLPIEEADTVLHEIIHIIEIGCQLELEEKQVRVLATMLLAVFQDNPELAKYLIQSRNISD